MGEGVEQRLAGGDLNRPVEPAIGEVSLHRSNGLDPRQRDAPPQLSAQPPARFVHTEVRSSSNSSKKLGGIIRVLEEHFSDQRPLRYFRRDESRWGLCTELGRRITLPGIKPMGAVASRQLLALRGG